MSVAQAKLAFDHSLVDALDQDGFAVLPRLLTPEDCQSLKESYDRSSLFRSRVIMARHGFGRGEYQYFTYPLPKVVQRLRESYYPALADIANRWQEVLGLAQKFPDDLDALTVHCAELGQSKPTPLLLKYKPGDYNCLHQDRYGEFSFPLQMAVLLSKPEQDFLGGEFVLTEQRPRRQSRVCVVPLHQGDAVVFPVAHRPVKGARGYYRVNMRHGVSTLLQGERYTLGIIFHDAL